ncbi:MAG: VWA domain-containing protein [Tetrasphaera sp.]|nr:VWA domain-containing protein [Tetrasphaera sp.]
MTNHELTTQPLGVRRSRVSMAASLGSEPVLLRLRTTDPAASIAGLWAQQAGGYLGMFNRPARDLPKEVTISAARVDGSAFPPGPPLQVTVSVGLDTITWSVGGLGGMPNADIVTLVVSDDWLTLNRPSNTAAPGMDLPPQAAKMAAAARHVLGVASVPDAQRAHVVVVVDASGSMKTTRARSSLNEAAQALIGIHAVLGGESKRLEWHLATSPPQRMENVEDLQRALNDAPYRLASSLDLPEIASTTGNEPTVVYLVTDDVPGRLADFADVMMQARHLVVLANEATAPTSVGPVDVTVWPLKLADDSRLPALAKDLLRGCFDADSACGRAVAS